MTTAQFKEAFRRGLGSAMIELRSSDNRDAYKVVILWCCLHNTCYDMQSEGDRSTYLYSAIDLFEDKAYFEYAIIKKYQQREIDTWLFEQLSGLLYYFAANGSEAARDALYQRFEELIHRLPRIRNEHTLREEGGQFEWLCVWLTSLDGFAAFKTIIDRVSIAFSKSKSPYFIMDWFYVNSAGKFGKKRVRAYMEKQAAKSSAMDEYWQEFHKTYLFTRGDEKRQPPTLQEFVDACRENVEKYGHDDKETNHFRLIGFTSIFARKATPEDLSAIANMVIAEDNIELKSLLFKVFCFTRFPLGEDYLFDLLNIGHEEIRDTAFMALEFFVSDAVRDFAVRLLTKGKETPDAIRLLCKNYREADEALLFSTIKKLPITLNGEWHGAQMAVLGLFERSSFIPKTNILVFMYRKTFCSHCRHSIVEILHKKKLLSEDILEECLYDSYDNTRELARRCGGLQSGGM